MTTIVLHGRKVVGGISEGEALVQKLREAGVSVEAETFTGLLHGFVRATGFISKARDAMSKTVAFIRRVA